MNRYIIPVLAALVIALFGFVRHSRDRNSVSQEPAGNNHTSDRTCESANPSSDTFGPARTKSKIRTNDHKPTIEETTELLRNTIIPRIDFPPDQLLVERVAQINQLIQSAGVDARDLRLILDKSDQAVKWRMESELRIRDVPVAVVLKYLCDVTKLRYHLRENGIIELSTRNDDLIIHSESNRPYNPNDPFSDPPSTNEMKTAGEDDPFEEP